MNSKQILDEKEVVEIISSFLKKKPLDILLGIGDDCAIVQTSQPLAITTDLFVENTHFNLGYMTYKEVGYRVMAANLSDLAAMGATPWCAFLSLGIAQPTREALCQLLQGMLESDWGYDIFLAGGDTVKSANLTINLCLLGKINAPLKRSLATPGQLICVTGDLGSSAAGLFLLQKNDKQLIEKYAPLVQAHKKPVPRLKIGQILAAAALRGAVMDISDGLATDLARLCEASQVGAVVEKKLLPIARPVFELAGVYQQDPYTWALQGGEDFELLFTCPSEQFTKLEEKIKTLTDQQIKCIGRIENHAQVLLLDEKNEGQSIAYKGFDHFRQS